MPLIQRINELAEINRINKIQSDDLLPVHQTGSVMPSPSHIKTLISGSDHHSTGRSVKGSHKSLKYICYPQYAIIAHVLPLIKDIPTTTGT